jgi:murein L,D-transpeptidase YcbB/YkuD
VIRKWLTKQFAVNHTDKQAVKRLQMRLVRMQYLRIDQVTMIYDQDTFNAIMAFQVDKGIPADGVVSKATLTEIFASEINRTLESEDTEEDE